MANAIWCPRFNRRELQPRRPRTGLAQGAASMRAARRYSNPRVERSSSLNTELFLMEVQSRQELVGSMWRSICADLENRRAAIHAEITAYPTPIPACDADFNYLLEERAKILHEMDIASSAARTREDSGQAAVAIEQF